MGLRKGSINNSNRWDIILQPTPYCTLLDSSFAAAPMRSLLCIHFHPTLYTSFKRPLSRTITNQTVGSQIFKGLDEIYSSSKIWFGSIARSGHPWKYFGGPCKLRERARCTLLISLLGLTLIIQRKQLVRSVEIEMFPKARPWSASHDFVNNWEASWEKEAPQGKEKSSTNTIYPSFSLPRIRVKKKWIWFRFWTDSPSRAHKTMRATGCYLQLNLPFKVILSYMDSQIVGLLFLHVVVMAVVITIVIIIIRMQKGCYSYTNCPSLLDHHFHNLIPQNVGRGTALSWPMSGTCCYTTHVAHKGGLWIVDQFSNSLPHL